MDFFNNFTKNDYQIKIRTICFSCKMNKEESTETLCTECYEKCIITLIYLVKNDKLDLDIEDIKVNNKKMYKQVYDQVKDIENSSAHYFCGVSIINGWTKEEDKLKGFKHIIKSIKLGNKYAQMYMDITSYYYEDVHVRILLEGLYELIDIQNENIELKCKIEILEMENADLRYRPGGVGYQEAKEDFETHIEKNE
jgi:hypothetical protein